MAYDASNKNINCGGYGYATNGNNTGLNFRTIADIDYRFGTSGTLTEAKLRIYTSGPACGVFKLKVLSGTASPFTLEREIDLTTEINAVWAVLGDVGARFFEFEITTLNLQVDAGDFMAIYFDANFNPTWQVTSGTQGVFYGNGDTETLSTQLDVRSLVQEYKMSSNETITYDNSSITTGDVLCTPFYEDQNQYFIFQDVVVPDTEDLDLVLKYTDSSTGADTEYKTLSMSFDGGANDAKISIDGFVTSQSITGQEGDSFDLHIWINPNSDQIQVIYVNQTAGQGPTGEVRDIRFISLQADRTPVTVPINQFVRRVEVTQNTAAKTATIGQAYVCRKPVLACGDSIGTVTYVGGRLGDEDIFSEQRVVILSAVGGNSVSRDQPGWAANIRERWSAGLSEDDARLQQDLVAFRDVVTVFINGPGVNDIKVISAIWTDAEIRGISARIAGDVSRMAGDSISTRATLETQDTVTNDTVLCEMIPKNTADNETDLAYERQAQEYVNSYLAYTSYLSQIPIAFVYDNYDANGGYVDAIHPDTDGVTWIAEQIAGAYEQDKVATASEVGIGSGGFFVQGG